MNKCEHNYENPIRKGRANFYCKECGEDISVEVVLIYEALNKN